MSHEVGDRDGMGSGGGVTAAWSFTSAGTQEGVAAKVGDLYHHAIVHHTVGGLETPVSLDVTDMEVGHALSRRTPGPSDTWSTEQRVSAISYILLTHI